MARKKRPNAGANASTDGTAAPARASARVGAARGAGATQQPSRGGSISSAVPRSTAYVPSKTHAGSASAFSDDERDADSAASGGEDGDARSAGKRSKHGFLPEEHPERDDARLCFICKDEIRFAAFGRCNHRVCHVCCLRMRTLYKIYECMICKTMLDCVLITSPVAQPFESFNIPDSLPEDESKTPLPYDRRLKTYFETKAIMDDALRLLLFVCPVCKQLCPSGSKELRKHVQEAHNRQLCKICLRYKKVFIVEQQTFTKDELDAHINKGNPQDGFRGHPRCGFCSVNFYDIDALFDHNRKNHERCHICERQGKRYEYFQNYHWLENHFREAHYLCEHPECMARKTDYVFENEIDFRAHEIEVHQRNKRGFQRLNVQLDFHHGNAGSGSSGTGAGNSSSGRDRRARDQGNRDRQDREQDGERNVRGGLDRRRQRQDRDAPRASSKQDAPQDSQSRANNDRDINSIGTQPEPMACLTRPLHVPADFGTQLSTAPPISLAENGGNADHASSNSPTPEPEAHPIRHERSSAAVVRGGVAPSSGAVLNSEFPSLPAAARRSPPASQQQQVGRGGASSRSQAQSNCQVVQPPRPPPQWQHTQHAVQPHSVTRTYNAPGGASPSPIHFPPPRPASASTTSTSNNSNRQTQLTREASVEGRQFPSQKQMRKTQRAQHEQSNQHLFSEPTEDATAEVVIRLPNDEDLAQRLTNLFAHSHERRAFQERFRGLLAAPELQGQAAELYEWLQRTAVPMRRGEVESLWRRLARYAAVQSNKGVKGENLEQTMMRVVNDVKAQIQQARANEADAARRKVIRITPSGPARTAWGNAAGSGAGGGGGGGRAIDVDAIAARIEAAKLRKGDAGSDSNDGADAESSSSLQNGGKADRKGKGKNKWQKVSVF